MKKIIAIMTLCCVVFTACGTETATDDVQTTSAQTTVSETTAVETNVDSEKRHFEIYEIEVKEGVPQICDIDAIMSRRRDDMAEKGTHDYMPEEYSDVLDYAEEYFKYSFDESDPVCSYVEDDFDFDGKTEYYLCMAEYVAVMLPDKMMVAVDADTPEQEYNAYDITSVTSVYYIDDDGTEKNTFSKLIDMSVPEPPFGNTAEEALNKCLWSPDENNLMFQIQCGYGSYDAPLVIDNGDSKHLFWKSDNSYPCDYGAEIFWLDKHCRVEISSPSSSLGGFYEWGDVSEELFFKERDKFGDDFWATTINLATKLDCYTYPEINGKVNTLKWDGSNYVYDIIEKNPYGLELKSGPVEWD